MGRSHESIDVVQAPGLHEVRVEGTLVGEYKDIDTANLVADAFLMYFCVRESAAAAEAAVTSASESTERAHMPDPLHARCSACLKPLFYVNDRWVHTFKADEERCESPIPTHIEYATSVKWGVSDAETPENPADRAYGSLKYAAEDICDWWADEGHDGHCKGACVPCQTVHTLRLALASDKAGTPPEGQR